MRFGSCWLFSTLLILLVPAQSAEGNGTGYVIERIEVRGNQKTKSEFIIRSLLLQHLILIEVKPYESFKQPFRYFFLVKWPGRS